MKKSQQFWNREYQRPRHLALSFEPSSDLQKFVRWLVRHQGDLNSRMTVLDLGCGNGRNLIWLAQEFGCRGIGHDNSAEAIKQAKNYATGSFFQVLGKNSQTMKKTSGGPPLAFSVRSLTEPLPQPNASVDLVLDMMSSHVLLAAEREKLRAEIVRVLKPGGWLFFKSFLLTEDLHAKRLLRDSPAEEAGSYLHPTLGGLEHVWTIDEIEDFFQPFFILHKMVKSHKHLSRGRAFRRRTVSVYLEKTG